jgi:hypothetical protein
MHYGPANTETVVTPTATGYERCTISPLILTYSTYLQPVCVFQVPTVAVAALCLALSRVLIMPISRARPAVAGTCAGLGSGATLTLQARSHTYQVPTRYFY